MNVAGNLSINFSCYHSCGNFLDGTIKVNGNVSIGGPNGAQGPLALQMVGASNSTLTYTSGPTPSGNVTINKTAGAKVTLGSSISFNSAAQTLSILAGSIDMAGFNLTLNALSLSGGTSISRNAGILTVGGSAIGAGPYSSGTISN